MKKRIRIKIRFGVRKAPKIITPKNIYKRKKINKYKVYRYEEI